MKENMSLVSNVIGKTLRFFVPHCGTQNDRFLCHPEAQPKDPDNKVDFFGLSSLSGLKLKRLNSIARRASSDFLKIFIIGEKSRIPNNGIAQALRIPGRDAPMLWRERKRKKL
jgi:hypothetical protein